MLIAAILCLSLQAPAQPRHDPVPEGLRYLVVHQADDGSWGAPPPACTCRPAGSAASREGDLESTAWAIVSLMGSGYQETSDKELSGRDVGKVLRTALDWLVSKQDKDGVFNRNDPVANALAALALMDAYGYTLKRKEPAVRAYAWVEKAEFPTVLGRIRQGMVIESGKMAEIGQGHDEKLLALAKSLEKEEGDVPKWGSLLLKEFGVPYKDKRGRPRMGVPEVEPLKLSPETLNVFVTATHLRSDLEPWHDWYLKMKEALARCQRSEAKTCESGSWDGESFRDRLRATAIHCWTLDHRCPYSDSRWRKK